MVAVGALPLEEAPKAIDFDTIILLLGVMIAAVQIAGGQALSRGTESLQTLRWRKQSRANPSLEWGEFPASWENTGNSSDSGLDDANLPAKRLKWSMTYKENSLRLGTGN